MSTDRMSRLERVLQQMAQRLAPAFLQQSGQATNPTISAPRIGAAPPQLATPPTSPSVPAIRPAIDSAMRPAPESGLPIPEPVKPEPQSVPGLLNPQGQVAHSLFSNLQGLVSKKKKEQESRTAAHAKFLANNIYEAMARGDQTTVDAILDDTKNRSILEKGLGYVPEIKKPAPPEARGVQQALTEKSQQQTIPERVTPQPSGAAQVGASAQQTELMRQQAEQRGLQKRAELIGAEPELARAEAVGTTLRGKEVRDTERAKAMSEAGIEFSPVQQKEWDENMRQHWANFQLEWHKMAQQERMAILDYKAKKEDMSLREKIAKWSDLTERERIEVARTLGNKENEISEKLANVKKEADSLKLEKDRTAMANKVAAEYERLAMDAQKRASALDIDSDDAKALMQQAEIHRQQAAKAKSEILLGSGSFFELLDRLAAPQQ